MKFEASIDNRWSNLDILRLLLALEVLFRHAFHNRYVAFQIIPPVPAFVCLSGLLIPASFSNSRSWGHFAWKRVLRVVPAFLLSFVLLAALFGIDAIGPAFLFYATAGLLLVTSLNPPLWSLLVEEVLYVFHGLVRTRTRLWGLKFAAILSILCFILVGVLTVWFPPSYSDDRISYIMHVICATSFFLGNVLYFCSGLIKKTPWFLWLISLLICMAAYVVWDSYLARMLLHPLIALQVVALAYLAPQLTFRIPDFSYSVYVFHTPMLFFIRGFNLAEMQTLLITLLATGSLSVASWYLVEKPILQLKNVRFRRTDVEQLPAVSDS